MGHKRLANPPTIGIDGRTFEYPHSLGRGIGQYTLYHVLNLARLRPEWRFVLYMEQPRWLPGTELLASLPNLQLRSLDDYAPAKVNLVHLPDVMQIVGFDSPMRVFRGQPATVTFQDLIPLRVYWEQWPEVLRYAYQQRLEQLRRLNGVILSISEHTRQDLMREGVPASRITTILAGLNQDDHEALSSTLAAADIRAETLRQLGIDKPFFLHVGSVDPHKNFDTVIKAFVRCRSSQPAQLVVVGELVPQTRAYADYVKQHNLTDILFTGFIARPQLVSLYREAVALVFLSRYEGFGLPVLEAMANRCPVIASNVTSLPEVAGDAAWLFDPSDELGVAQAMLRLLQDADQRDSLRQRGLAQAARFSWQKVATKTLAVWEQMLQLPASQPGTAEHETKVATAVAGSGKAKAAAKRKTEHAERAASTTELADQSGRSGRRLPEPSEVSVAWFAPIYDPSGYADEARHFILELEAQGFQLAVREIGRHSERFREQLDQATRLRLDSLLSRQPGGRFISLVHFPAYALQRLPEAIYNIGRVVFETDGLPPEWVTKCNQMDEIWVASDFNLETFRRAGVTTRLVKVPEGVDTHHFRPGCRPLDLPGARGFVFLSIFEWIYRKGWDVLLRAWADAFKPEDDVSLVLRTYPINAVDQADAKAEIERRIDAFLRQELGLSRQQVAPIVVLGEPIAEQDMPRLYAAARAYVAPSRGEGWGRPHMEAMACGLPVIATGWGGNLEFMNDANSLLLDIEGLVEIDERAEVTFYRGQRWAEPSVAHLVARMRQLVERPEVASAIGQQARRDMVTFWQWDQIARLAGDRLREVYAELIQPAKPLQKATSLPATIRWEGSQFVTHSLALINRELCLQLIAAGCELSIIPYEPDQFGPEADPRFAQLAARVNAVLSRPADVHVRHRWPPNLVPPTEGHWVMIQPWEFGSLPRRWVEVMSTQLDEMWVPSSYVRECYVRSGVPAERVFVVPNGVNTDLFRPDAPALPLHTTKSFRFLFVGGTIGRKGIDILLDAYTSAFSAADDVCLVIKDMGGQSFYQGQTAQQLIAACQARPNAPEIEYIERTLSDQELAGLYTACHCLVHPYRGEGFGLPIAEAMASGLPVIVTQYGAALDFCNPDNAYLIPAREQRLPERRIGDLETVDYPWLAEPDRTALKELMRHVVEHPAEARAKGQAGRAQIVARFTWPHVARIVLQRIETLRRQPIRRFAAPLPPVAARPTPARTVEVVVTVQHPEKPKELAACLKRLRKYAPQELRLSVSVVNASGKLPADRLQELNVSQLNSNTSAALQTALASGSEYVLLLSSDVRVTPNWLETVLEVAEADSTIAALAPTSNAGPEIQQVAPDYDNLKKGLRRFARERARQYPSVWREARYLGGFCLLLKSQPVLQAGGLDCEVPLSRALWTLYERLRTSGYRLACVTGAYVHHAELSRDEGADFDAQARAEADLQEALSQLQTAHATSDWPRATQLLQRALELTEFLGTPASERAILYNSLGYCQAMNQQPTEAVAAFQAGLALDAHHLDLLVNLANVLMQLGRFDEAAQYLQQASHIKPDEPTILTALGNCAIKRNDVAQALASFRRALELEPGNVGLRQLVQQLEAGR